MRGRDVKAGGRGTARTAPAWLTRRAAGLRIRQAAPLGTLEWLVHGFTTRPGGASLLDGERVLNLGFTAWDTRAAVRANRRSLLVALGAPDMEIATLRQCHSDVIHGVTRATPPSPTGDAQLTRTPGLLLAVQTADCLPILLVDRERRAVAAVHAGWRGTLKRIVAKTLGRMRMAFGTRPKDVVAALGPGIGRCCYEVGAEVVQAFAGQFAAAGEWFTPTPTGPQGKIAAFEELAAGHAPNPLAWLQMSPPGHAPPPPGLRLDLAAANRWQLLDAGLPPANIHADAECTACRTHLLFSHRREQGRTGRQMGVVGIRAAG